LPADPQPSDADRALVEAVHDAAHLLPAQGPISAFIHHNTLHAFEVLPFEMAVVEAAHLLGCEPFLSEERYRRELSSGRIRDSDLVRALDLELRERGREPIGPWGTRLEVRALLLRHAVRHARGAELDWLLREVNVLREMRDDVPPSARVRLVGGAADRGRERQALLALWHACRGATADVVLPAPPVRPWLRHRDGLWAATGADADALVHPLLIRLCAAFLDQGLASLPMPDREQGLYRAFLRLYGAGACPPDPWLRRLPEILAGEDPGAGEVASLRRSLEALGVAGDRDAFLSHTLLALRGWAGMTWQIETRPDRVFAHAPPASLVGFLAVRLLLERAALRHVAGNELGFRGSLAELRDHVRARIPPPPEPSPEEAAYLLLQVAQIEGRRAEEILGLPAADVAVLFSEILAFDEIERRRTFQLAYERRHRVEVLDALASHAAQQPPDPPEPDFIAILCIDEREESLRRHLEEVHPACETFGAAGFFGVAMYYRGIGDAHAVPLCPIAVRPQHEVEEVPERHRRTAEVRRAVARRAVGRLAQRLRVGSRTLARGTMIATFLGALAAVPLIARVLLPGLTRRVRRRARAVLAPVADTDLVIDRRDGVRPTAGTHAGYTKQEMADIVGRQLEEIGLLGRGRLAPLVIVIGHGSSSLNNPHESAHDCGACGGNRGGPNARAFAQMARDPAVRAILAARGTPIPEGTCFVGGMHNNCDDAIELYDLEQVEARFAEHVARAMEALDLARLRNAHERCRRFETVPSWFPPALALAHVEARAEDLAQVRPEYGHATNATAFVGRRGRTRGLFLDRRTFLVSYDPTQDDERGSILGRVLSAVAPVMAGINLEYYFSYVDPSGYGCGTKLPHNLVAHLGVMDGHQSDLRTGLPWQMTEIHEPVRLTLVVETRPEIFTAVVARHPALRSLVAHRWLRVALMDPQSGEMLVWGYAGLRAHERESLTLPSVAESADWYRGRRDHLPCARVQPRADRR
jgi:hypothetical protein